ncbi:MAG TPA: LuxR C-terminal-related transcriptional regulator [Candidatus Dormibacteraeota bacterium]|nr:LuxR C-terminal-related transcriptional regulator [Candidatus Dormibacteraeota bacterium]
MLLGRRGECEALARLIAAARGGEGGAIVVRGEPGIGKTALIESAVGSAQGFQVVRAVGHEAEVELPFAALHQLCRPGLDDLERLAGPQRDALRVAFGLSEGDPPDRLLVGLAVLSLLAELAARQPILCVVDDAQWLDTSSAQAVGFVARRVASDAAAFVVATRRLTDELTGLPELSIEGLGERDARDLLDSVLPDRVDERVLERIVAETHGNPLALIELPRGLTPAQLAGGFGLPVSLPLAGRIEESFRRRLVRLPPESRRLLLVAAAEPTGDPMLVWRAAELLGIPESAADAVEAEGLMDLHAAVVFRHPLVRSAVYGAASPRERREAHRALAEATDPAVEPDRRAWHRAQATSRPDEDVARELELSAGRAQARGGFAAAAAFMERSAALTVDPARRARRALVAAEAKRQAGALEAALGLAAIAERGPLDDFERAQLDVLRARISFASQRGSDAPPLLLTAAGRLAGLDVRRSRETYLDALTAALFAGRLAKGPSTREVAAAVRAAPRPAGPPRASDLLLDGLALLITDGYAAGTPVVQRAVQAFRGGSAAIDERLRWSWVAGRAAAFIWDFDNWDALTADQLQVARDAGALTVLPLALSTRGGVHLFAGELSAAASLVDQITAVADATDNRTVPYGGLVLAALRGREDEARPFIDASIEDFVARGEGMALSMARWATAAMCNGRALYDEAFGAAQQALENPDELWYSPWAMVELIEAASRTGHTVAAATALERLARSTGASGTDWGGAVEARSRALVSQGEVAETLYREAIERLAPTATRFDLARTHLVYGEWLRRERRNLDAREQLRTAEELFTQFGMEGFAERARVELRATGEHVRKRNVETQSDLTAQEAQISQLAARGATNQEIAAQLFISPSTVEYHLYKVFRKLGVRSRTQLAHRVLETPVRP